MTKDLSPWDDLTDAYGPFAGLYGGFWGIIAGPTGVRLSKPNNLSRFQCLWKAYITLIVFTLMGSLAGVIVTFIFDVIIIDRSESVPYVLSVPSVLSSVQIILIFGKINYFNLLIRHIFSSLYRFLEASWSSGCSKCQLNQSLEQIIQDESTETVTNNDIISN